MARRSLMNIFTIAMLAIVAMATITVKDILRKMNDYNNDDDDDEC